MIRRTYGCSVFLCADSIPPGTDWSNYIKQELIRADLFIHITSEASVQSMFCTFELGMAVALDLAIRVITVDRTLPPLPIRHLQAADTQRLMDRRPWLTEEEATLIAMTWAMGLSSQHV